MIEELLEGSDIDYEVNLLIIEALAELPIIQLLVIWYWLLGFTQEETRHRIFPVRSRAYIWQTKNKALTTLQEALKGERL